MVCWFHFTHGNAQFLQDGQWLFLTGNFMWTGVEVFFVISGFIIPHALFRSGYQVNHFFRFFGKRLIRLEPPYLSAVVITVLLWWMSTKSPGFAGQPMHITPGQAISHLGYMNDLLGYGWFNPAFWTLAIEFQYYILIGLIAPFLLSEKPWVRLITIGSLAGSALIVDQSRFVFHWLFVFLMGTVTFYRRAGFIRQASYFLLLLGCILGAWKISGEPVAIVGGTTSLIIAFARIRAKLLVFFGTISYSLYLLHVPIGGRVINLSLRFVESGAIKPFVVLFALALSCAAAFALYWYVERPAQAWSSRIRYRKIPN